MKNVKFEDFQKVCPWVRHEHFGECCSAQPSTSMDPEYQTMYDQCGEDWCAVYLFMNLFLKNGEDEEFMK